MVHLDNLDKRIRDAGYTGVMSKSARRRVEAQLLERVRVKLKMKCLLALKRKHWVAIIQEANSEQPYECFGQYATEVEHFRGHEVESNCHYHLKRRAAGFELCQACVIVTKLLTTLED